MDYPLGVEFRYEASSLLIELDDIYTHEECDRFIALIEAAHPTLATNNPLYRDQDRVIIDDKQTSTDLFNRIRKSLPETVGQFRLARLNERLRYYRYAQGQRFAPHMDHWYQASDCEISLYTVLVYFNDNFSGGETRFSEQFDYTVVPKPGKVAIFQHKLRHEGCEIISGIKYAVRTDVIYKKLQRKWIT